MVRKEGFLPSSPPHIMSLRLPHPLLAPYVQSIGYARASVAMPPHLFKEIPGGAARIGFRENFPDGPRNAYWGPRYELHLYGTKRSLREVPGQGREFVLAAINSGGLYPLIGIPAGELTDQLIPLETLWGNEAKTLLEQLVLAPDPEARCRVMERALIRRLRAFSRLDEFVLDAARLIEKEALEPTLTGFYQKTGYSQRQVHRKFEDWLGLSPKQYSRAVRFKQWFGQIRLQEEQDWSEIAAAYGYFDKAHLFHDFQKLTGQSPARFLEEYRGTGMALPGIPQREILMYSKVRPEDWFRGRLYKDPRLAS